MFNCPRFRKAPRKITCTAPGLGLELHIADRALTHSALSSFVSAAQTMFFSAASSPLRKLSSLRSFKSLSLASAHASATSSSSLTSMICAHSRRGTRSSTMSLSALASQIFDLSYTNRRDSQHTEPSVCSFLSSSTVSPSLSDSGGSWFDHDATTCSDNAAFSRGSTTRFR